MKPDIKKILSEIRIIVPDETAMKVVQQESKNLYNTDIAHLFKILSQLHLLPRQSWMTHKELDDMFD